MGKWRYEPDDRTDSRDTTIEMLNIIILIETVVLAYMIMVAVT